MCDGGMASEMEGRFRTEIDWEGIWDGDLFEREEYLDVESPNNVPYRRLRTPPRCKTPSERSAIRLLSFLNEIIASIIQLAADSYIPHPASSSHDKKSLARARGRVCGTLSLVCRNWRHAAQWELFTFPSVSSSQALEKLVSFVQRRKWGGGVKGLAINFQPPPTPPVRRQLRPRGLGRGGRVEAS